MAPRSAPAIPEAPKLACRTTSLGAAVASPRMKAGAASAAAAPCLRNVRRLTRFVCGIESLLVKRFLQIQHRPENLLVVAGQSQVFEHCGHLGLDEIIETSPSADVHLELLVEIDQPRTGREPQPVMFRSGSDVQHVSRSDRRLERDGFDDRLFELPVDWWRRFFELRKLKPVETIVGLAKRLGIHFFSERRPA